METLRLDDEMNFLPKRNIISVEHALRVCFIVGFMIFMIFVLALDGSWCLPDSLSLVCSLTYEASSFQGTFRSVETVCCIRLTVSWRL